MQKLRIGFDDLDATNKEIFLDIACLFEEYCGEEDVKKILDIRGFYPDLGLPVLNDKSLITIRYKIVCMTKLLRHLGKYIVREKSPKEPSKWSRLWDYGDLQKILSDNMDEANIEAIVIRYIPEEFHETTVTVNALSKLRSLKLLLLPHNFKSSGSISDLSNEIGYFKWYDYPRHCLPQSFQPHKLVELILQGSNIKQLWEDSKLLHNLKHLDLSYSEKLVKLQNFGDAINLESLFLRGCIKLKQIDPTSGFPRNLTTLKLKDCRNLINLPHFRDALNLQILNLEGCTKLGQIDPSIGLLKKLTFLNLKDCKSPGSLPDNILELNSLEYLSLFGCSQLYENQLFEESWEAKHSTKLCICEAPSHSQSSSSIFRKVTTRLLPLYSREHNDSVNWLLPSISIFSSMCQLDLSFCNLLQVPDAIGNSHSLERLWLMGNNFTVVPNLKELSKLIHLNLQHCKRLENLPELPSQIDVSSSSFKTLPPIDEGGLRLDTFNYWLKFDEHGLGLNIFNCPELGKRESCKNMCFAWMMQIVKAHHQYNDFESDRFRWPPRITSIIAGSEIPSWFNGQHVCTYNSMTTDTSHVICDNDCLGVAFCAIFAVRNERRMDPPNTKPDFRCRIPLFFCEDLVTIESDHLLICYIPDSTSLEMEISGGEGYDVEVKKYGYCVVYKEDLQSSNFNQSSKFTEIE